MAAKKAKKEKNANTCQSLRIFPGWLTGNEEIFLAQMAGKGWMLDGIYKDTVYHFRRIDPKPKIFAVEFLGKRSAPAEEIADDCNAGWDFIGQFGKKRYYCCDRNSPALVHPSADSESEQMRLSTSITNLTTLLLLNIPGTLYCLLYTVLLFATNGLMLISQFTYQFIYIFGTLLGIASIYVFLRWILAARKRSKKIWQSGGLL